MAEADIMTDYQFKSIIQLVTTVVESANSKEEAIKALKKLSPESEQKSSKE